ncbi:MAG: flagellar biosynthetic protein FliR [Alicyclobacillaceae bacterium]|nr:flagellar biosynthetic protein FliR [Alicyclobacillaceae bacterium]
MSALDWAVGQVQVWLLIFARVAGWVVTVPVFSSRGIPLSAQMGLAGVLSLLAAEAIVPAQGAAVAHLPLFSFMLEIVKQWLIGAALGFIASLLFLGAEMAGQLLDIQMGFSMVNLLNPQSGTAGALMANWQMWLATMIFLSVDGHHAMLAGLLHSFDWVRLGAPVPLGLPVETMVRAAAVMLIVAVQLAAPILLSLLLFDLILAFVSRAAPQVNVLFVALSGKILAGWGVALVTLPVLIAGLSRVTRLMNQAVDGLLRAMGTA